MRRALENPGRAMAAESADERREAKALRDLAEKLRERLKALEAAEAEALIRS